MDRNRKKPAPEPNHRGDRSIGRRHIPPFPAGEDLLAWRERILFVFLASGLVIGFFVLVPSLALAVLEGEWAVAVIDGLAVFVGLGVFFARGLCDHRHGMVAEFVDRGHPGTDRRCPS